jgi:mono/diheme cytochrome c family protein
MRRRRSPLGALAAIVLFAAAAVSWPGAGAHAQAVKGGNLKAAAVKNPVKPTPDSIRKGRQQYQRACRHCHGVTGVGDGPLAPKNPSPPNLTDATWDYGSSDGEIYTIISNGIGGNSEMKGHRSEMTAADMWNIVNYLRSIGPTPPK